MTTKTPIALFAYNRPDHMDRALDSLFSCRRIDECDVHIFCDGPSAASDEPGVIEVRRRARRWTDRLGATVVERDMHAGLAQSIVDGVTSLCDSSGRVIVVEDDLVLVPDFLDFMLQGLDRYEHTPSVYQIAGYMFPVDHPPTVDAFFMPYITTWGWATWSRAWRCFDGVAANAATDLRNPDVRRRFDLNASYPYARMLEDRLAGRNDSWGILWWWSVFSAGGLALHPRQSLVWNDGFDNSGTHCGRRGFHDESARADTLQNRMPDIIAWPKRSTTDSAALERVTSFLRSMRRDKTRTHATSASEAVVR